ncbi:hypothetical protein GCM10009830_36480 [Glycomyces endophyticus]|uniref:Uncharacterized protein n=1 Tax=Glycomyces endophyticus TaxID=480996 RepID=A0ABN2HCN3_9ACTN
MQSRKRAAGAVCAALALAAAAACSDDGAGEGAADPEAGQVFEEDRLVTMVNESARLQYELESAEYRIIQDCLERDGFAVHDPLWFTTAEPEEQDALYGAEDWGNWLPDSDEAARYGLGVWAITEGGQSDPDLEAYRGAHGGGDGDFSPEAGGGGAVPDDAEFAALSPQEQYDWYTAYFGEATAVQEYGHLVGAETADGAGGDGEIDLGGDFDYVQPEPGGCQREMIDALYGDMELVEDPEGGEYRTANWSWRPVNPVDDFAPIDEAEVRYREGMAAVENELVACLDGRGRAGWVFDEEGSLPLTDYFFELYEGSADVHDHPDLPGDAPSDYEGQKAFEIAFAVDLAACGDETGFRDTAEQEWADSREAYYLSIETAVYAWQDEIRAVLETAQDVIEG